MSFTLSVPFVITAKKLDAIITELNKKIAVSAKGVYMIKETDTFRL